MREYNVYLRGHQTKCDVFIHSIKFRGSIDGFDAFNRLQIDENDTELSIFVYRVLGDMEGDNIGDYEDKTLGDLIFIDKSN